MRRTAFAFALCAVTMMSAHAQDAPADILFMRPHLAGLPAGAELIYRLDRKSSDTARLGEPFSDDITLTLGTAAPDGSRDVSLRIFSGERARAVDGLAGLTGNPVLVIFLDRAVANLARLTGGKAHYLKARLRAALRDQATSTAATAEFAGRTLEATRIVVRPFADGAEAGRLLGYEDSEFAFLVAEAAPGMLLEMKSSFVSTLPDAPKLEESIALKSAGAKP
ncbi:hypothetical protein ASE63_16240 [Bosea sp. Root381]|uniref:hypothetical protein n=1 Tax=Bosea sp. Root381 TaxID=1736524 RepID=UPI0006F6135B|nr:hypothetical protein [Bosea sp. Root381]KRE15784.1 hypothetical protein ASE63_16240 [Bosea sp. Root381]